MSKKYIATLIVRSYELDSFGHVNNAVYLQYLEYARCQYMNQAGLSFQKFHDWGVTPFVTRVDIQYKSPCFVDNDIELIAEFTEWRRVGFTLEYEVNNKSTGQLVALATVSFGFADASGKITKVPKEFKEKLM